MRTSVVTAILTTLASALFLGKAAALGSEDAVALRYHFAGAAALAENTNFDRAKRILTFPPARHFQDLVLDRWAGIFSQALQFDAASNSPALLRPLLNDLLQAESVGSFGGRGKDRMDFVLAARLDAKSTEAWQKSLATALHGPGEPLTTEGFSGLRWNRPGHNAIWILRARDWVVAGRGEDLLPVREQYLQGIKQDNRPATVTKEGWLGAEVDWPLLATWTTLSNCPVKLARTSVEVTSDTRRLHATATVSYPEAVPWQSEAWRIPKEWVGGPLSSFTASQDLAAYLQPNSTLSRLSSNPLTNQLFCWAMRELPLLNYAAWPVTEATNTLRKLGTEGPAVLNPILEARDHTHLKWAPKSDQLTWLKLQLTSPTLEAVHDQSGDFLLAKLFPMEPKRVPVADKLWSQFEKSGNLVYYDWEITSMRLRQWRLLTELLPVYRPPPPAEVARQQKAAQNAKPPVLPNQLQTPLAITDAWLAELTPALGLDNTVTEVTRTSPTELTVVRNSQFLFTGLELVLLSHWLADAPVGPIDNSLLPQAKMTGPGMPRSR